MYGNVCPLTNGITMNGKVKIMTVPTTLVEINNAATGNDDDDVVAVVVDAESNA